MTNNCSVEWWTGLVLWTIPFDGSLLLAGVSRQADSAEGFKARVEAEWINALGPAGKPDFVGEIREAEGA